MRLRRLKWVFLLALVLFFLFVEFASYNLAPFLDTRSGRLLMDLVTIVGCLFLLGLAFDLVSRMNRSLERQNRELLALHRAAQDIYGDLSLSAVLQKVVAQSAQLLEARYGAVAVYGEDGEIQNFVTCGVTPDQERQIGSPPAGKGLLAIPLAGQQRLRLREMASDPRSAGMPPGHPSMSSLLAVPINCKGPFRGNLYLAEKESAPEFSKEDEQTLVRFATAAAISIDNAHLHQRLRALAVAEERVRLAREMHDGMAQILAYVNTKAQAVKEYLRQQRSDKAGEQLEQLAEAAREVHVDVREQIVGLRTRLGPENPLPEALRQYLDGWESRSEVETALEYSGEFDLTPMVELQVLRIVQEALSNVRKHARAGRAAVRLAQLDGQIVVTVDDDGEGFDPEAKQRAQLPRFGLAIMRERAESIGGRMTIDSRPGEGTRIRVEFPADGAELSSTADGSA